MVCALASNSHDPLARCHQVSFLDEGILSYRSIWFALERGADALFVVDIFVNLNRAVVSPDGSRLVTNRWDIFWHYLRHGLILDCAASIPWDLVAQAAWSSRSSVGVGKDPSHGSPNAQRLKAVRVIRLLQLLRLEHVFDGPRRWGSWVRDHLGMTYAMTQLVSFLSGCILIAHWLACLYHFSALVEPGECNWCVDSAPPPLTLEPFCRAFTSSWRALLGSTCMPTSWSA